MRAACWIGGVLHLCVAMGENGAAVARMCWEGIAPIAKILGMLALIGVLTGLWRAAGVIPAIVYYAVPLISPGVFLLATFLLNCLVSVLTGTSFGTAATVGSICISMAGAMGVPLFAAGGVALSAAFFGDRCSPISASALLVADLTGTDFYNNLKRMVKSAAVPFVLTCAAYFARCGADRLHHLRVCGHFQGDAVVGGHRPRGAEDVASAFSLRGLR